MPLASVIIPTHNQAAYIAQTVDSALAQTGVDVEVIVVDDGSTDYTCVVLERYGDRITRLSQENRGPSAARNAGWRASRGDYVLFLDSDDTIPPNKLALHMAYLNSHPECGLVYSAWQQVDAAGLPVREVRPGRQGRVLRELLRREFFFFPSATVLRRECLERVGEFDESITWGEDADLWLRIARAGYGIGYIDQPLLRLRVYAQSLSARLYDGQLQMSLASLDRFFGDPELPAEIRAMQSEAYSVQHYETAARYYRAGRIAEGQEQLRRAIARYPMMDRRWLLDWLAGSALDSRTVDPRAFLDLVLDNLPLEAIVLAGLRRPIFARFHTTAVFSAYQSRRFHEARRHLWPALVGDPSILKNRGFVRIAFQALCS